jgi:hypothetical protein
VIFLSIFIAILEYSLACLCIGVLLLHGFGHSLKRNHTTSAGTELASAYLVGQGILANIWVLMALRGWFSSINVGTLVFLLAVTGIVLSRKLIFEFIKQVGSIFNQSKREKPSWKLIIVLTLLICAAWSTSLGRSPIGDGSAFYLPLAKVTADSHRLQLLPGYEELTSIGLQGEMHFAALMSMGSVGAAQLFSWPTILAGAILLLALGKNAGVSRRGQWLMLAILFTSSALIELSGTGKTDLFAAALGMAAYYWAIRIRDFQGSSIFWRVGLFTGLTLVAKISYMVTFLPSIGIIILWGYYERSRRAGLQASNFANWLPSILIGITGLFMAIIPHLVKNHVLFENPLAPFGTGTSGIQDQTWSGPETTRRILFTIPFALTFGEYWAQMGNVSPLALAFAPLAVLLPRPRRVIDSPLFIITISSMIGILTWFILRPSVVAPRYYMACLLLLIIPAARAADFVASHGSGAKVLQSTVLTVTILAIIAHGSYYLDRAFFPKQTFSYLSNRLSECEKAPKYCGMITIINNSIGPGERLFTNTFVRYWLRADLIQCALTTEERNAYRNLDTPEQRWSFIFGRGFRYIPSLPPTDGLESVLINKDLEHVPNWLKITRIVDGDNILLELHSTDPSHKILVDCNQMKSLAWELSNK